MIKIKKVGQGEAPPLKKKGVEIVVWENFTEGNEWNSLPYTRYFLLRNGKQIGGFDVKSKYFSKKMVRELLERHKIKDKNVYVYVK